MLPEPKTVKSDVLVVLSDVKERDGTILLHGCLDGKLAPWGTGTHTYVAGCGKCEKNVIRSFMDSLINKVKVGITRIDSPDADVSALKSHPICAADSPNYVQWRRRFGIGRIETSGSVAMRGYSHLSDDEREQIGLLKVLGHSIGAIARAIRRPKSRISRDCRAIGYPAGATRRFTSPELINCAGGVKR